MWGLKLQGIRSFSLGACFHNPCEILRIFSIALKPTEKSAHDVGHLSRGVMAMGTQSFEPKEKSPYPISSRVTECSGPLMGLFLF